MKQAPAMTCRPSLLAPKAEADSLSVKAATLTSMVGTPLAPLAPARRATMAASTSFCSAAWRPETPVDFQAASRPFLA